MIPEFNHKDTYKMIVQLYRFSSGLTVLTGPGQYGGEYGVLQATETCYDQDVAVVTSCTSLSTVLYAYSVSGPVPTFFIHIGRDDTTQYNVSHVLRT